MENSSDFNATVPLISAESLRAQIVENPLQVSWFNFSLRKNETTALCGELMAHGDKLSGINASILLLRVCAL